MGIPVTSNEDTEFLKSSKTDVRISKLRVMEQRTLVAESLDAAGARPQRSRAGNPGHHDGPTDLSGGAVTRLASAHTLASSNV